LTPIALVRAWLLLRATSRHATGRPPCTRPGPSRQRPSVCWTADSGEHDQILRTHGPCRGSLRPRSPGCRLAGRSGHLIADGPRTARFRPDRYRFSPGAGTVRLSRRRDGVLPRSLWWRSRTLPFRDRVEHDAACSRPRRVSPVPNRDARSSRVGEAKLRLTARGFAADRCDGREGPLPRVF
jgi:hypothetical protein